MANFTRPFTGYKVHYMSYRLPSTGHPLKAQILLRNNGADVLRVRLVEDPSQFVHKSVYNPDGFSTVYDNIDQLPLYLDILRNEKPLYVTVYDHPNVHCYLKTFYEPVGEEES